MKTVIVNPLTRISGAMEIEVYIENNVVVDAKTEGLLFRGFEKMLPGRAPLDAIFFTERICGICSTAHSIASSMALEDAFGIAPSEQGRYLRDILHGCEFLQNHIRHFYQYTVPDFVKLPSVSSLYDSNHNDFRLPQPSNDLLAKHYFDSLNISRNAHEMLAILGGKAPHNHGVFVGGISGEATADKIIAMKSILSTIGSFIDVCMIPDVYTIAEYYSEYYHIGRGYGNLLSYGCFNHYEQLPTLYLDAMVYMDNTFLPFIPDGIVEKVDHAWFRNTIVEPQLQDDMNKEQAYSWVKAPRYYGLPCEVGPLARQWLAGEYTNGISTLDRTIARVLEAKKITAILGVLLDNLKPGVDTQGVYQIPDQASGRGLVDTTRGALGHWVEISAKLISSYNIITPSTWNLSTKTYDNQLGTAEKALIGTIVNDTENPVELGRIIRSFDPCVSCATHVYSCGRPPITMRVIS